PGAAWGRRRRGRRGPMRRGAARGAPGASRARRDYATMSSPDTGGSYGESTAHDASELAGQEALRGPRFPRPLQGHPDLRAAPPRRPQQALEGREGRGPGEEGGPEAAPRQALGLPSDR